MQQSYFRRWYRHFGSLCALAAAALVSGGCGGSEQAASEALIGQWAVRSKAATVQDLPLVGMQASVTTALGVGEVKRDAAGGLIMTQQLCNISISGGTTTIDDIIPQSTAQTSAAFRASKEGDVVKWSRDETISLVGVMLTDPANEALPTMPTDPRVVDQDQDGKAGVTVHVATSLFTGDVYVVQRQRVSYSGTQTAEGKLSGQTLNRSEQIPVDATNALLLTKITATPDDTLSKVDMARLSATYSCERLKAEAATLFPP